MLGRELQLIHNSFFSHLETHQWALLAFLGTLLFLKVIATSFTIGSGGNGGIFAGSLFSGALTGFIFARFVNLTGLLKIQEANFVAAGMAGVIAGVVHAPLTAIFLIAEITGGYSLFVPLMIVAAMSYFISRYFEPASVYTRPLQEDGALFQGDRDTFLLNRIELTEILETNIQTVSSEMPVVEVIKKFTSSRQNVFPVLDEYHKFKGIILLEDLKDLFFDTAKSEDLKAKDIFIQPPAIIYFGEKMADIMQKFDSTWVWKLPVLSEKGAFIGFVSKKKIFTKYREMMKLYNPGDVIS